MRLPYLSAGGGKQDRQIIQFGGVRYGQGASDGELEESLGLSSAQFPCLSQREGRKRAGVYTAPTALYAKGKLCVVDGTDLLYDGQVVGQVSAGEKQLAAINTRIVIFPDKMVYDTEKQDLFELGMIRTYETEEGKCTGTFPPGNICFTRNTMVLEQLWAWFYRVDEDYVIENAAAGSTYTVYSSITLDQDTWGLTLGNTSTKTAGALQPGDLLILHTDDPSKAARYQQVESVTANGDGTYAIRCADYFMNGTSYSDDVMKRLVHAGDKLIISGCTTFPGFNLTVEVVEVSGNTITAKRDDGYFYPFAEAGNTAQREEGSVKLVRSIPDLEVLCEHDNRLWGAAGGTIYASALGDPGRFFDYEGLSTDSYAVAVGTDGAFTGCAPYGSNVLFWKEDYVHKVLGTSPKNYELYVYKVPGVQAGSEKSLCIINEALYYKGREGVYRYTGSTPTLISENFGLRRFSDAVAGTDGWRYYISMKGADGSWGMYVYDTMRGIWLREDDTHAMDFANLGGTLCFLDAADKTLYTTGQDDSEEGRIQWSASFAPFHETVHGRKGYSRLFLRLELSAGAWCKAEISEDGGAFRQVWLDSEARQGTVVVPIRPARCDAFRVRLSGKGRCVVKSLVRRFEIGSEV